MLFRSAPLLQSPSNARPEGEYYSVSVEGSTVAYAVSAGTLDAGMQALQLAVIAARKQCQGSLFSFNCIGGRIAMILIPLAIFLLFLFVHDSRQGNRMMSEGERVQATVVERAGANGYDKNKSITVRYPTTQGEKTSKIEDYLSAENWDAAKPGASVNLLYHPKDGVFVASDIERFQRQTKFIFLLPIFFLSLGIVAVVAIPRYQIGSRKNGDEYIVKGDQVLSDDMDMPISRTKINVVRMLWRLL